MPPPILAFVTMLLLSKLAYRPSASFSSRLISCTNMLSPVIVALQADTPHPYTPPSWADGKFSNLPKNGRLNLANLPTPLHKVGWGSSTSGNKILQRLKELNINLYVKRDDASGGAELGGNKIRKLEFLLADALAKGCDCVVTIGGEQSNHCRATAAASRMVGLSPHLVLRTKRAEAIHEKIDDIGWTGNILFDRMVGSTIYTCTPGEYGRLGSKKLVKEVCGHIRRQKEAPNNPYPIPVGGSNGLGTWGYLNAVDELMGQLESLQKAEPSNNLQLDHVVFATGSGGTAAGITLGFSLAFGKLGDCHPVTFEQNSPKLHAVGVCDNPDYFYQTIASIANEMGLCLPSATTSEQFVRDSVTVHNGKGRGYAISTEEELDFILQFSLETGIALDPVYSGKALYFFLKHVVEDDPKQYQNSNILFWHTGGALGMYDKGDDMLVKLKQASPVKRIDAYGKKAEESSDDILSIK